MPTKNILPPHPLSYHPVWLVVSSITKDTLCTAIWYLQLFITRQYNTNIKDMTYLLTYLLTPWSRVLLEKLASFQLVKKFPAFYGTRRFLTALTSARHLSLYWASPIQSSYPNPTSWRSILILSSPLCLGLPSCLFPSGFPTSTLYLGIAENMCGLLDSPS